MIKVSRFVEYSFAKESHYTVSFDDEGEGPLVGEHAGSRGFVKLCTFHRIELQFEGTESVTVIHCDYFKLGRN